MSPRLSALLALPKITHDLQQGSTEWDQFRLEHRGASEAAPMLGLSTKVKRSELMRMKHTGIAREFGAWFRENVLDRGHETEAHARPHVETDIVGDDLYPVTCSRGILSASCDGLTMDDETAFEHKQWNEDLAAMVGAGVLPDEHWPQCQQVLLVMGAKRLFFVVSDGTPNRMVHLEVLPEMDKWEQLVAGWEQFDRDLEVYVPPAPIEVATARPIESLPTIAATVTGSLTITSNVALFSERAKAFIATIPAKPTTDQEFADCEAASKELRKAEDLIKAARASALGQVVSVEELMRSLDDAFAIVNRAAIDTENVVKRRKKEMREEQVARGQREVSEYISGLNLKLEAPYMPRLEARFTDFAGAISGLKKFDSIIDAINTTVANAKVEADRIYSIIRQSLATLEKHREHDFLFADKATLVLKTPEDLQATITARMATYREPEEERKRREAAALAPPPSTGPDPVFYGGGGSVRSMPTRAAIQAPRTLNLTTICARLGVTLTAAFVRDVLKVRGEQQRNATLFSEPEFDQICVALQQHLEQVREQFARRAA